MLCGIGRASPELARQPACTYLYTECVRVLWPVPSCLTRVEDACEAQDQGLGQPHSLAPGLMLSSQVHCTGPTLLLYQGNSCMLCMFIL